jgi:hypothetical protein
MLASAQPLHGDVMATPALGQAPRPKKRSLSPDAFQSVLGHGALLIAGFFTFPFGRLLGTWLLG